MAGNAFVAASDLFASGNVAGDAIIVETSRDITGQGTWLDAGIPYLVAPGATLHVATGGALALEGGALVKLGAGARIRLDGELDTSGTATAPCIFTSVTDDQGGDTNRNGATTGPGKGDWEAIEVAAGGVANLVGSDIRYGNDGVRVFGAGTATLVDCNVHHQLFRGIALGPGALGFVQGTTVHDCDVAVQVRDPANAYMSPGSGFGGSNHFTCDATVDVENLGISMLDARANYWGAAGPAPSRTAGPVDTTGWLPTEPAPSSARRLLTVHRWGTADLVFAWPDTSTCSRYDLTTSDQAGGTFWNLASALSQPTHVELQAARSSASLVFYDVKLAD